MLKPVFGIFAVVGWLVLIGLHTFWHRTFGWLFRTLADLLDAVGIPIPHLHTIHPFGTVSAWLRSLDRNIDAVLVKGADGLEGAAVWLLSRVGYFFGYIGHTIAAVALAAEHKLDRLVRVTVPRLIRHALAFVWRELRALGRYARKMIPKLARQLLRFSRWAAHEIAKGARHLGFVVRWAKAVLRVHWRAIRALIKRAARLESKLSPKGFRGVLVRALGGLGVLWLLTDAVRELGTWLSKTPLDDIREWVNDATEAVNFCTLAAFQYDIGVHVIEPLLTKLVASQDWYCTLGGDTLPIGVTAKPGYLGTWEPIGTTPIDAPLVSQRLAPGVPLPQRNIIEA